MTTVYKKNLESLPELDLFSSSNNDFLKDIQAKASKYLLSDRQVEAAQRAWDKIKVAKATGQTILSPWDENLKQLPELESNEFSSYLYSGYTNSFLTELYYRAKRYILSDKQIEMFKKIYKNEINFYTPADKVAFDLLIRAVSMTPRGDWILQELGDYYHSHKIKIGIYTKIIEKAHHFRKSIFGHIFDSNLNMARYYIKRIGG